MARWLQTFIAMLTAAASVAAQGSGGLRQCSKGEMGCSTWSDQVEALFFPWHDFTYHRTASLTRYTPDVKGAKCGETKFHKKVHLHKNKCFTFDEAPVQDMYLNYRLPNNKLLNHCDLTMFDGKECRGYVVWNLNGTMQNQVINGQRFCHKAPWGKSVIMGPCS